MIEKRRRRPLERPAPSQRQSPSATNTNTSLSLGILIGVALYRRWCLSGEHTVADQGVGEDHPDRVWAREDARFLLPDEFVQCVQKDRLHPYDHLSPLTRRPPTPTTSDQHEFPHEAKTLSSGFDNERGAARDGDGRGVTSGIRTSTSSGPGGLLSMKTAVP